MVNYIGAEEYEIVADAMITHTGAYNLHFTPAVGQDNLYIRLFTPNVMPVPGEGEEPHEATASVGLKLLELWETVQEPGEVFGTVCKGRDEYRFGFNGIEKVNEVAGAGNHYSAFFGEYDPRVVTRWNTDPKPVAWESPYAMFRNNPILNVDPLLDYSMVGAAWRNIRDGGSGIYKSGNEWGYNAKSKIHKGEYASFFGGRDRGKTFSQKAEDVSYKFDRWAESSVAPAIYKVFGEWNPVAQGATNLGSSVTGRDMTIPAWNEGSKPGANVSGQLLSPARRVTTGLTGATQFIGIGLGGASSFATDWGLNAVGDGANQITNSENAGPSLKYGYNTIMLLQAVRNKDVGGIIEESMGITNTASGQVDNALKNEKEE